MNFPGVRRDAMSVEASGPRNYTNDSVAYASARCFLLASAILHILGSLLSGFTTVGLFLLFPAAIYIAFFFGLKRKVIWVAWLVLVCMLGGMAGTLMEVAKASSIPAWVLWGIFAADLSCATLLSRVIWKDLQK